MNWIKKVIVVALAVVPVMSFADEGANTNVVWKRSIALGMTYKDGNTEKTLYTADLKGDRVSSESEFINSLHAEYGRSRASSGTQKEQTEGQLLGKSEYRYKFGTERLYASVNGEIYHDAIKDISYRAKLGPNIGYYFIQRDNMRLDASIGINYVFERVAGVDADFGEYRAAGRYVWNISESSEYYLNIEYNAAVEDTDNGNGLLVTGVKSKINNQLSLFVEGREEYDNMPAPGIEHTDTTVIAGLSYDF